ncbi:MAG: OsmC family protein [Deltaproteobacteria bacterium]|nr:OsmC family protein [Deltaproteobacteria bacterium]
MVEIEIRYEGDLHTTAVHGPSSTQLATDAPKDNMGRGESFSPTDLVATALGTCIATTMDIVARRHSFSAGGTRVRVAKHMVSEPTRRIGKLEVAIDMPRQLSAEQRALMERTAHTCPVAESLSPAIEVPIDFRYSD